MAFGKEKQAAFDTVDKAGVAKNKAQQTALRKRDLLDDAVAAAVTSEPWSVTWYATPGTLTIDEVATAAGLTVKGIHNAMERQRERAQEAHAAEKRTAKKAARPASRRKRAQRAARAAAEPTPKF